MLQTTMFILNKLGKEQNSDRENIKQEIEDFMVTDVVTTSIYISDRSVFEKCFPAGDNALKPALANKHSAQKLSGVCRAK